MNEKKGMRPIWYFVGLLLVIIGILLTGTGIYYLLVPAQSMTVLQHLHPNIWWGGIMLASGLVLLWINKGVRVK